MKIQTTLRIEDKIYDEIEKIAKKENRSINKQILYFIEKSIDNYKNIETTSKEKSTEL